MRILPVAAHRFGGNHLRAGDQRPEASRAIRVARRHRSSPVRRGQCRRCIRCRRPERWRRPRSGETPVHTAPFADHHRQFRPPVVMARGRPARRIRQHRTISVRRRHLRSISVRRYRGRASRCSLGRHRSGIHCHRERPRTSAGRPSIPRRRTLALLHGSRIRMQCSNNPRRAGAPG